MPDFLKLLDSLSGLSVKTDVRMREYTSFKIGGEAPVMVEPRSAAEVLKILSIARKWPFAHFYNGQRIKPFSKRRGRERRRNAYMRKHERNQN